MSDLEIDRLILDIYGTTTDHRRWPQVLTRFADLIGARGCIISEIEGIDNHRQIVTPYVCERYDAAQIQRFLGKHLVEELQDQARYEELSSKGDPVELVDQRTFAGDDLADYLARPGTKRMQSLGISERAGALLDKDNKLHARFSLHFGEEHPGLTDHIRQNIARLLPHIGKAIEVGRSVRQANTQNLGMLEALDRFRIGVCVLDRHGRVEVANAEFHRQVDAFPLYSIDPTYNTLHLRYDQDQQRLNALLSNVMEHGNHGARPRKEGMTVGVQPDIAVSEEFNGLCLEVVPLHRFDEIGSGTFNGAVIYSLDTTREIPFQLELLIRQFGLTPAEEDLTAMIGQGLTNNEIADQRGRALNTVNTQVKTLLKKTQCSNRTQLLRLAMSFGSDLMLPAAEVGEGKQRRDSRRVR